MSSEKVPKFWRTLAFRLTLWYGGVLAAAALGCFLISYFVIATAMRQRSEVDLTREGARCSDALKAGGITALRAQIDNDARATGTNDIFMIVYDSNGLVAAKSDFASWSDITLPLPQAGSQPSMTSAQGVGHHALVRIITQGMDGGYILQAGVTVQDDARALEQARQGMAPILLALIGAAVWIGWLLARRALLGVQQVTNIASDISRGALQRRVQVSGYGDEIDQLASMFNQMLGRIQALVDGMKSTNDNIAHELRSPITRIRGLAETTLTGHSSLGDFQEMAAGAVEECDSLLDMINAMLDIAEAEAGVMSLRPAPLNAAEMLRKLVELYEPVVADKKIHMTLDAPEIVTVIADVQKLQRVAANMLDNAVKYTPEGGEIALLAAAHGPSIELAVCNTGIGIAAEDLPHIFKRFFRADKSRSGSGNGLGLSLAAAIVHAHGGHIDVQSVPNGRTTFTVTLPVASRTPMQPFRQITNL